MSPVAPTYSILNQTHRFTVAPGNLVYYVCWHNVPSWEHGWDTHTRWEASKLPHRRKGKKPRQHDAHNMYLLTDHWVLTKLHANGINWPVLLAACRYMALKCILIKTISHRLVKLSRIETGNHAKILLDQHTRTCCSWIVHMLKQRNLRFY